MPPDPLSDHDYERLARLLAGEGTPAEREASERWAAADAERTAALESMRLGWNTPLPEGSWNVDAGWARLSARVSEARTGPLDADRSARVVDIGTKRRLWRDGARIMKAAAAAVILVGGALILPRLRQTTPGSGTVASAPVAVSTGAGERRAVNLPDGSSVVLGVTSTLRTREGYGAGAREVELSGEAFFTVTHDEANPFRVIVNGTVVEDLGTEFAVRGYGAPGEVRVAVASGSVAVRRGTTSDTAVVLLPRDVATVDRSGVVAVQRGIDVDPFTAFAFGRLIFVDAALSDVADELARWYGVDVRVADPALADRHLTSTFSSETPLEEVLRVIALALDVRSSRNGNVVEFSRRERTSWHPQPPVGAVAEAGG